MPVAEICRDLLDDTEILLPNDHKSQLSSHLYCTNLDI